MKYIYGPVKSRRLGLSLGISLTPCKICSFNCIYCQLGKAAALTCERKEYAPVKDILMEFGFWLENNTQEQKQLNYITISGAGEPSLNTGIGQLIKELKKITVVPVAVITNASLLSLPIVRRDLISADLIVPSLDAVTPLIFAKVNRPEPDIKIEDIIEGLASLRKEYKGQIWLEIMLVKGLNDDIRQIRKFKDIIEKIRPDKIHLNSPVRHTAETGVLALDEKKLKKIKEVLGDKCEII